MKKQPEEKPFEPQMYPEGIKLFEVAFTYQFDIGIPSIHPIVTRLPQDDGYNIGGVRVERSNGSLIVDDARVSAKTPELTKLKTPIEENSPVITVDLKETQPIHYRINKVSKTVSPLYRSRITVRFIGDFKTQSDVIKKANAYFNQYLKAYRVASGDPVPYVHDDRQELRLTTIRYQIVAAHDIPQINNLEEMAKFIENTECNQDGGMSAGINSTDYDLLPKPYIKDTVYKTVKYALMPESIPLENEPILEAIELAHRRNEYGLAVVLLHLAFEAVITTNIMACLVFQDKKIGEIRKIINQDHPNLEDKRNLYEGLRDEVLEKYNLPKMKHYRGSAEEQKWNKSTSKKRHSVVHITNAGSGIITKKDFEKSLADTQTAIKMLELPIENLKEARKKNGEEPPSID